MGKGQSKASRVTSKSSTTKVSTTGSMTNVKVETPQIGTVDARWKGNEASAEFVRKLKDVNLLAEFKEVETVKSPGKLTKWTDYMKRTGISQSDEKYLDEFAIDVKDEKCSWYPMTKIEVPEAPPMILTQLPTQKHISAKEFRSFWTISVENKTSDGFFIGDEDELANLKHIFLPKLGQINMEEFCANTRNTDVSAEVASEDKNLGKEKYTVNEVEVIENGVANIYALSRTCTMRCWSRHSDPPSAGLVNEMLDEWVKKDVIPNDDEQKTAIIVSSDAGRAGTIASISIALYQLRRGKVPNILKIVKEVRRRKPGAVESLEQYTFIYISCIAYLRQKMKLHAVCKSKIVEHAEIYDGIQKFMEKAAKVLQASQ